MLVVCCYGLLLAGFLVSPTTASAGQGKYNVTAVENNAYSQLRNVQNYDIPAFSMLLRLRVDDKNSEDDFYKYYDDEFDGVYVDLEILQETLEHVTQLHLQHTFSSIMSSMLTSTKSVDPKWSVLKPASFHGLQLSCKVRQETTLVIIPDEDAVESNDENSQHIPLHAAYSGVVTFSFQHNNAQTMEEESHRMAVQDAIAQLLEHSLVAENYLLLFRRYMSTNVLANIEDISDISIGTKLLSVLSPTNTASTSTTPVQPQQPGHSATKKKSDLNAVTIVAIVLFMILTCVTVLFATTIVLLMKDRAKQERIHNGQTMSSLGMGAASASGSATIPDSSDEEATTTTTTTNKDGNTKDESETSKAAWKRALLPILRKAIMVRRYWKKQLRKQRQARRRNKKNAAAGNHETGSVDPNSNDPNLNKVNTTLMMEEDDLDEEDDDGLKDEDIYYDDGLSDEEAANLWLDSWSQSLTSIPVRKVKVRNSASSTNKSGSSAVPMGSPPGKHVKKKKIDKHKALAPNPAKRQSKKAFLCCIAEEDSVMDGALVEGDEEEDDDDDSDENDDMEQGGGDGKRSSHSSTCSGGSSAGNVILQKRRDHKIQELATVIMEEDSAAGTRQASTESAPVVFGASARRKKQETRPMGASGSMGNSASFEEEIDGIEDVDLTIC